MVPSWCKVPAQLCSGPSLVTAVSNWTVPHGFEQRCSGMATQKMEEKVQQHDEDAESVSTWKFLPTTEELRPINKLCLISKTKSSRQGFTCMRCQILAALPHLLGTYDFPPAVTLQPLLKRSHKLREKLFISGITSSRGQMVFEVIRLPGLRWAPEESREVMGVEPTTRPTPRPTLRLTLWPLTPTPTPTTAPTSTSKLTSTPSSS